MYLWKTVSQVIVAFIAAHCWECLAHVVWRGLNKHSNIQGLQLMSGFERETIQKDTMGECKIGHFESVMWMMTIKGKENVLVRLVVLKRWWSDSSIYWVLLNISTLTSVYIYQIFNFISSSTTPSSIFHQQCHSVKLCSHQALLLPCNCWHHDGHLIQRIITSIPKIITDSILLLMLNIPSQICYQMAQKVFSSNIFTLSYWWSLLSVGIQTQ